MTDREREALQLAMDATAKAAAISDLASTVDDFTDEVRGVREDIAAEKAWRRRFVVALAVMAGSLLLLAAMGAQLLSIARTNRENGELIRDVVTPGGEVYERNRQAQAGVIADLIDRIDCEMERNLNLRGGECP